MVLNINTCIKSACPLLAYHYYPVHKLRAAEKSIKAHMALSPIEPNVF